MAIPSANVFMSPYFNFWGELFGQLYAVKYIGDDRVLIGGALGWFHGDHSESYFACVNTITGEIDTTYNSGGTGFNGTVYSIIDDFADSTKKIIVGAFTTYNGNAANGMIRLNSDGSKDNTFVNTGATTGTVFRAVYFASNLYLVGNFSQLNGVSTNTVAKLDTYGTVNSTFATNIGSGASGGFGAIYGLGWLGSGSDIIIGGSFSDFNGTAVGNIARVNSNGVLQTSNSFFDGYIWDLKFAQNPGGATILWVTGGFENWTGSTEPTGIAQQGITQIDAAQFDLRLRSDWTDNNTGVNGDGWFISPYSTAYDGYIFTHGGTVYNGVDDVGEIISIDEDGVLSSVYEFGDTDGNIYGVDWDGERLWAGMVTEFDGTPFTSGENLRVIRIGKTEWEDLSAPTNLQFVSGGTTLTTTQISWVNHNNDDGDYNLIQYKDLTWGTNGGQWIDASPTVSVTATTYTITGLIPYAEYEIRVVLVGSSYPSDSIFIQMPPAPPSFCADQNYTISGTTCGNSDGSVNITNSDYEILYDFELLDVDGSIVAMTGLSAGYYFMTATVKSQFQVIYGADTCEFEWLAVSDSDTTMSLDNLSIRNVVCGGFGDVKGRFVFFMSDSGSDTYSFNLYKALSTDENAESSYSDTGLTPTEISQLVIAPLTTGDYYAILTNESTNCRLLIGMNQIQGESLRAVSGIKRVFVTEWNNLVEYNYWSDSDEDYYVSGVDPEFFNSIKIKEFIDDTLPSAWFEIVLDTKGITYSQVMNKTHQGFIFTDTITITIPHADNAKWKQLVDFLVNRYIIVFQDNSGDWWVMGYRLGAAVDEYKRSNNEYILTLNAISGSKILTNIAEQYVVNNIIA